MLKQHVNYECNHSKVKNTGRVDRLITGQSDKNTVVNFSNNFQAIFLPISFFAKKYKPKFQVQKSCPCNLLIKIDWTEHSKCHPGCLVAYISFLH